MWHTHVYEMQQKCLKREAHSNKALPQETRKVSNKQPNFIPQKTRKRTNK